MPPSSTTSSFEATLAPLLNVDGLPFADVLTHQDVQDAYAAEGCAFAAGARSLFNPALILWWAWLSQVLSPDKSCRAAVMRILVLLVALEREPCSADTAAYCRARAFTDPKFIQP